MTSSKKVGIIGCGHLGRSVALSLLRHGFSRGDVLVSYRGNPSTYDKIKDLGLAACIADNETILNESDVVFLLIKPQDATFLKEMPCSGKPLVMSSMAGVSVKTLKSIFKTDVCRMMFSGPDTLLADKGIAAIYPSNAFAAGILTEMKLHLFETGEEDKLNIFTMGVCLPAALLKEEDESAIIAAVSAIGAEYPPFAEIYAWAKGILPAFATKSEKEAYIARMVTKGGVTEAIISSLAAGEAFETALRRGIARSREISGLYAMG